MVWFARWRPRYRKLFLAAAIVTALGAASVGIKQEIKEQPAARQSISKAEMLRKDIDRKKDTMNQIIGIFQRAIDYQATGDELKFQGRTQEAMQRYREALLKLKSVKEMLPKLELRYLDERWRLLSEETGKDTLILKPGKHTIVVGNYLAEVNQRFKDLERDTDTGIAILEQKLGVMQ